MPNILLVEDNEMNRDMLSRRLERKGYKVSVAVNGKIGIEKALEELPDLILMDLSLPEIDGWEATRILKKDEKTSNIPIIALTAHVMKGDKERALQAGCDDYDSKPVEMNSLISKIESLLNNKSKH